MSRKDLLALDFEGVLKYFRVHLPKRYRSEDTAKELLLTAIGMKVSWLSCYLYVVLILVLFLYCTSLLFGIQSYILIICYYML